MMKLYQILSFLLTGTCFWACSGPTTNKNQILINLDKNVEETIPYSSFVDSISYIALETNDECLIGKIRDIIISDSMILVLNEERTSIHLFNISGNYIRTISHVGIGPGEYNIIEQFTYNKRRNSISVASCKIIEYDLHGNLINEFDPPCYISDLYQFDNGDYLFSRLERIDKPDDLILLADSTGKIKEHVLKRNPLYNIESTNYWEFSIFNNEVHFISPQIDNILYSYAPKGIEEKIRFEFIPEVSTDFYQKKPKVPGLGENYYRTLYRESEKWLNLAFWSQTKDLRTILYNKATKQYLLGIELKNNIDNNGDGISLSYSENNTFTNYLLSEDSESNPTIQILHLKQE